MTTHGQRRTSQQGVFLRAAYFNHSCLPNACFNWNPEIGQNPQGRLTIMAIKDIAKDEEICIDYQYRDFYKTTVDRRQSLSATYKFQCTCVACEDRSVHAMNETIRQNIRDTQQAIHGTLKDESLQGRYQQRVNIDMLIGLLRIVRLEYPPTAELYGRLVDTYARELNEIRVRTIPLFSERHRALSDALDGKLDV
ncbi:MAG: hypothetical protein Q9222_005890 [Ikaeria aurantiellina]